MILSTKQRKRELKQLEYKLMRLKNGNLLVNSIEKYKLLVGKR